MGCLGMGGTSIEPLYPNKLIPHLSPVMLGLLSTTSLVAGFLGLAVVLPLLAKCFKLQRLCQLAILNMMVQRLFLSLATTEWQFFAISLGSVLPPLLFPLARTGFTLTF